MRLTNNYIFKQEATKRVKTIVCVHTGHMIAIPDTAHVPHKQRGSIRKKEERILNESVG
jgi:hypothetical protein